MKTSFQNIKTLRLVMGDQLNIQHSWYKTVQKDVLYVMMEVHAETDYVVHHIQKVIGFFAAMRNFAQELEKRGHQVLYISFTDKINAGSFEANCKFLIEKYHIPHFEYQLPDEFRVDGNLKRLTETLSITHQVYDTEHFLTSREELGIFFKDKKMFIMESFYRYMRKKHQILMDGAEPLTGKWNYDKDNRKKLPAKHKPTAPLVFDTNIEAILQDVHAAKINTIGSVDAKHFIWPCNREQSLQLLDFFAEQCLPLFGTYQDAMSPGEWSLYHSRVSFSLNCKLISPLEVVQRVTREWEKRPHEIEYNQLEGFVRQIIGWREYMRGIYWLKMPEYARMNYFNHQNKLPEWYWTGKTKMNCLKESISQSLQYAYAHHIQRLMVTGNFALLAGVNPDEVDAWYLGIYIDALDWVEITNTRGMSQFADGGIVGTKPYVSSAAYIDKMSHYCGGCYYNKSKKTGDRACPFNSLYWNFYDRHRGQLAGNPRIGMMYLVWDKMSPVAKAEILQQAEYYLEHMNEL